LTIPDYQLRKGDRFWVPGRASLLSLCSSPPMLTAISGITSCIFGAEWGRSAQKAPTVEKQSPLRYKLRHQHVHDLPILRRDGCAGLLLFVHVSLVA
jgi:hypothetical protein